MRNPISELFRKQANWGLRGDPYLWEEMENSLRSRTASSEKDLKDILESEFQKLTGHSIKSKGNVTIERYPVGGMSGGKVDIDHWRSHLIPELLARYSSSSQ